MGVNKRLDKGMNTYSFALRLDMRMYEKILKLKIVQGDTGSFNKWINKLIGEIINTHEGEIVGYTVDRDDSDF